MLIFGIILLVMCVLSLTIIAAIHEDNRAIIYFMLGVGAVFAFALIMTNKAGYHSDYSLKEYSVKTELRQEFINDKLHKTDTVYIFTPKKEK